MSEEKLNDLTGALSLATDAIPMSPRQSPESSRQSVIPGQNDQIHDERTNTGTEVQPTESLENIPDPPTDWNFNILLNNIGESLSAEDLSKMKCLFEGEGGIGKSVLEKIKLPQDLFRVLRTRGYISRDNLLYLQGILYLAGRRDLIEDALDYSKTVGNVLHLYAPSYQPENGYRFVKFHVAGRNFRNYSRKDVELLRCRVQKLLFVPEKFVIISGIEPSSSLVITFMIPEMYVEILQVLLVEGDDLMDLQENGVDIVEIDGKVYNIKGTSESVCVETDQKIKLLNVYEQLQQTKVRLDSSEMACIDLSRQINYLQSNLDTAEEKLRKVETELDSLKKVVSMSRDETQPASLKELTSLKEFTEALHQINIETVDKKAIQRLINASVNIVSTRMREGHRIQEQSLLLDLQNMQSQLIPLMFELEQHRFLTDLSHIDKSVLVGLQLLLQSLKAPTQISLTPHGLQMLKKISSKLRYKEKEKLRQKYQWTPDGKIEKSMAEDPNLFLACLYHKEIERTRLYIHCQSFVAECLTEVGREDLKKFLEPKPQPNPPNPPSPRYFTEARQKADPSQGQNSQQHQKQQQAQRQEPPQFQPQHQDQSVLITRMAQQI
ncbi:uncharacterized protein LOC128556516 isoform X1 [Mercenaria mercenaria]|uniref:uncharacterized protein LOC128556516 isoform X1 n=1 Tax=Mercenaria mercenaria TaxID=6596 RepID=UPI00234FA024|nr:uncharacterized protein LOC128556516 isoform X1 [Mercenaria mercenaria]